ncbi:hypothetical protein GCM10009547_37570 [Sporichthya brevicatena]|uniref:Flp family type IVb pilin n=1 Tax=Sporichthya brevicatena TaxID=171442 RepID=A0ABN1H6D4_9ACTN
MPTTLRTRLRGSRAGGPTTPVEYVLLSLAAVALVTLVFFALGNLLDEQRHCETRADATSASTTRC